MYIKRCINFASNASLDCCLPSTVRPHRNASSSAHHPTTTPRATRSASCAGHPFSTHMSQITTPRTDCDDVSPPPALLIQLPVVSRTGGTYFSPLKPSRGSHDGGRHRRPDIRLACPEHTVEGPLIHALVHQGARRAQAPSSAGDAIRQPSGWAVRTCSRTRAGSS